MHDVCEEEAGMGVTLFYRLDCGCTVSTNLQGDILEIGWGECKDIHGLVRSRKWYKIQTIKLDLEGV